MVLLIFLFLLLCIGLPLGEVSRITISQNISFTLFDILVGVGAICYLVFQLFHSPKQLSEVAKLFIIIISLFLFSLFANVFLLTKPQLLAASLYIVRFVTLGTIFFMVKNSSNEVKKNVSLFLTIGGTLLVVIGYLQLFFYPSLRNLMYLGWDVDYYRMFGTFFDPNFFGFFLVLFFLFLLTKVLERKDKKQSFFSLIPAVVALITFFAIFLTYSRTAFLALLVGLILFFWQQKFWKYFWGIVVTAILATGILFFITVNQKTTINTFFRVTSTDARIGDARNALFIFSRYPLFGVGFNAYRYAQYRFHIQAPPQSSIDEDHGSSGADSSLLFVLATSGITGFIAFCLFLFAHMKRVIKSPLGLATLGAFFVGSFFINGFFYPFLVLWLWVILGLTESDSR